MWLPCTRPTLTSLVSNTSRRSVPPFSWITIEKAGALAPEAGEITTRLTLSNCSPSCQRRAARPAPRRTTARPRTHVRPVGRRGRSALADGPLVPNVAGDELEELPGESHH